MKVGFSPKKLKQSSFMGPQGEPAAPQQQPLETIPAFTDMAPLQEQEAFATSVLQSGMTDTPLRGGWAEGLTRLGESAIGGYLKHRADGKIADAKKGNKSLLLNQLTQYGISPETGSLLTSDEELSQKLGSALLSKELKGGTRTLTPKESASRGYEKGVVVQLDADGNEKVIFKPERPIAPLVRDGLVSHDQGLTWNRIPGYIEMQKEIAAGRRKPIDNAKKEPWEYD